MNLPSSALETEARRGTGRGFEPVAIGQIDPDRIERRLDARRGDDSRPGMGKLRLAAAPRDIEIQREIVSTEGDASDTSAGGKDRTKPVEAERRLDNRYQIDPAG